MVLNDYYCGSPRRVVDSSRQFYLRGRTRCTAADFSFKKLGAAVLLALAVAALLPQTTIGDFAGDSGGDVKSSESSLWQDLLPLPAGDAFGCAQVSSRQDCWAGVYVDSASKEVLHLEARGRAVRSPGTAPGAVGHSGCLWWSAQANVLHIVDCLGRPFVWPGASGNLRRETYQMGMLAGFVFARDPNEAPKKKPMPRTSQQEQQLHLVRDPLGFVFPDCLYILSLRPGSPVSTVPLQIRVFLHLDGTVTDETHEARIATWSFAVSQILPGNLSESGATGDALELCFEADDDGQTGGTAGAVEGSGAFKLFSTDGGRTWLQSISDIGLRSTTLEGGGLTLSLVVPTAVSAFPSTAATSVVLTSLVEDETGAVVPARQTTGVEENKQLQPIVEIFQAQTSPLGSGGTTLPEQLSAVIVVSRAVPRPIERRQDLSCVLNGTKTPSIWLSWSMVICSTLRIKAEEITLYLTFHERRITSDFYFVHVPPPRHTLLAWPATEAFNVLPQLAHDPVRTESLYGSLSRDALGLLRGGPLSTTLVICTMFRNEGLYLEEWLQYHLLLGISKVYMYDNKSSDNSRNILKKYELSGFVQIRDWDHQGAQTEALNDCLCRFRHTARWMSFIDVDEFIDTVPSLPLTSTRNVTFHGTGQLGAGSTELDVGYMATRRISLNILLEASVPGRHTHCIPWVNYCAYGQLTKPPGGVLENFLQVEDTGRRYIHMQKPLFKALEALTLRMIGPHFLLYATEDVDGQYGRNLRCPYEWLDPSVLRIRHYRSKSLEEFVQRRVGADSAYQSKSYTANALKTEWQYANARCGEGRS